MQKFLRASMPSELSCEYHTSSGFLRVFLIEVDSSHPVRVVPLTLNPSREFVAKSQSYEAESGVSKDKSKDLPNRCKRTQLRVVLLTKFLDELRHARSRICASSRLFFEWLAQQYPQSLDFCWIQWSVGIR